MKYWILLATSLFLVACGGGESGGSDSATAEDVAADVQDAADAVEESANTIGDEVADTINATQEAAENVGAVLEENKEAVDEELKKIEDAIDD